MVDLEKIQKAREVIGEDAADLNDSQLAEAIAALDAIADMVIDCYIDKHRKTDNQEETVNSLVMATSL